jgi:hypothetical protein
MVQRAMNDTPAVTAYADQDRLGHGEHEIESLPPFAIGFYFQFTVHGSSWGVFFLIVGVPRVHCASPCVTVLILNLGFRDEE